MTSFGVHSEKSFKIPVQTTVKKSKHVTQHFIFVNWKFSPDSSLPVFYFYNSLNQLMKKMKISAAVVLILAIGTFNSYKKNNDKKPDCKISALSSPTSTARNTLSYDANGKLSRLISGG